MPTSKQQSFHVLAPFSIKAATTPPHDSSMSETGDSEVIKISGYANFSGLVEEGDVFIDLVGDVVVPSGIDVNTWKKNPQVLLQHMRDCTIGRGLSVVKKKDGLFIEAEIHKGAMCEEDFYRVKAGLLCFFSIGFRTLAGEYKKVGDRQVYFITKSLLLEVSVVGIPANGESSFQVIKALGDDSDGFYSGDLGTAPVATSKENEGAQMSIKAPWRELLPASKVKEMEALGMSAELDAEKEISVGEFRTLIASQAAEAVQEALAAAAEAEKAAAAEAEKAAAEEAEKAAAAEAEKAAAEEAEKAAAEEAELAPVLEALKAELATLTKKLAEAN